MLNHYRILLRAQVTINGLILPITSIRLRDPRTTEESGMQSVGTDSSDGLMPIASPSTPVAPSDNLSANSPKCNRFQLNSE